MAWAGDEVGAGPGHRIDEHVGYHERYGDAQGDNWGGGGCAGEEAGDRAARPGPGAVREQGDSKREYNRQPAGQVNYMITIAPDGKMSALRQVLTPQNFAKVLPGMPMEQVRKMLGKPMKVTPYALKQETHYDWRYLSPPQTPRVFTVVFDPDLRVAGSYSSDEDSLSPSGGNR